jgi:hypothetical protein
LVKVALGFSFLLHGVLAIAALHLSRLEPSRGTHYLQQAERHHDIAMAQFQSDIKDMNEENWQAVLLFSHMLFVYSFALPVGTQTDVEQLLDGIYQNFALTRQTRPMVRDVYQKMQESKFRSIVPQDAHNIDLDQGPIETELVKLRKFSEVARNLYPADINEAYCKAILMLEVIYDVAERSPVSPSDSLLKVWVHMTPPRFMELLSERQPGALIILAHYAVLFKRSHRYWYFDGVAEQMLHVAEALVPGEWKTWLEWPMEQIRANGTTTDAASQRSFTN